MSGRMISHTMDLPECPACESDNRDWYDGLDSDCTGYQGECPACGIALDVEIEYTANFTVRATERRAQERTEPTP